MRPLQDNLRLLLIASSSEAAAILPESRRENRAAKVARAGKKLAAKNKLHDPTFDICHSPETLLEPKPNN
jgi:hypothetical protein